MNTLPRYIGLIWIAGWAFASPNLVYGQGCDRLMLEEFRCDARSTTFAAGAQRAGELNWRFVARDSEVLRQRVVIPLDELLRPGGPQILSADDWARRAAAAAASQPADSPAPAAAVDNPFRDDVPQPAATPAPQPATAPSPPPSTAPEKVEADEDPFGDF